MTDEIDWLPMIRQRLAMDILPANQRNDYWDVLGLTPPGPDVAESMALESDERLQSVAPLQAFIEPYVVLVGDILSGIMYKNQMDHEDSVAQEDIVKQNTEVVRAAIYPILAVMLNTKVIGYGETMKAFM